MGRVFVIEKEGPVYSCSTCSTQIAHQNDRIDVWLHLIEFSYAYNVITGENTVSFYFDLYNGNEVSCVNCCSLLGWREIEQDGQLVRKFRFKEGRVSPPPPETQA